MGQEMSGPQAKRIFGIEDGGKKWNAEYVIEMGVAEENIGVYDLVLAGRFAHFPQARPTIENYQVVAAANLQTRRVAAIADGIVTGAGNAAPDTPKADRKIRFSSHAPVPSFLASKSAILHRDGKVIMITLKY